MENIAVRRLYAALFLPIQLILICTKLGIKPVPLGNKIRKNKRMSEENMKLFLNDF
jgi:hypothetical protein